MPSGRTSIDETLPTIAVTSPVAGDNVINKAEAAAGITLSGTASSSVNGQTANGGFWSKDGQTFFFPRDAGLLAVSVTGGAPHTAWPSAAR